MAWSDCLQTQYSGNYLYTACVACVKLSILFQYHRILGHASRPYFRWQVRALMGMVVIWTICIFMMSVTICIPLQRFWNPSVPGGCLNITDFYYGMQIPNILTDIFIVVCPVYEVYSQYFRQGRGLGRSKSSMIVALGLMFALGFMYVWGRLSKSSAHTKTHTQNLHLRHCQIGRIPTDRQGQL